MYALNVQALGTAQHTALGAYQSISAVLCTARAKRACKHHGGHCSQGQHERDRPHFEFANVLCTLGKQVFGSSSIMLGSTLRLASYICHQAASRLAQSRASSLHWIMFCDFAMVLYTVAHLHGALFAVCSL